MQKYIFCVICARYLLILCRFSMMREYLLLIIAFLLCSCSRKEAPVTTPWGTTVGDESEEPQRDYFSLADIQTNGELIMLTLTGPTTYYDYHGRGLGTQFLLCERFAQQIGVGLRVEVCKDTAELVSRLRRGDGDIAAFQLPRKMGGVDFCGVRVDSLHTSWAVARGNTELADTLNRWFRPGMIAQVEQEEAFLLSARSIRRHVFSPMLDRGKGIISRYDHLFQQYAPAARMDWRLMAAQCYQESCFDERARSWAGACGLMQIMPSTADHLGLPRASLYDPESNIAAAAKYMAELGQLFRDVENPQERINFQLASYNGGHHHIRDAMALARKYGRNSRRWGDVAEFVRKLSQPQYYNDPVVRYGYMRGSETADYVDRIRVRWMQYRGFAPMGRGSTGGGEPRRAKRKYRFHV